MNEVKEIVKDEFLSMVYTYHYSIVMPRHTKYYLGYFIHNKLVGGISLGWGTQPKQTIQKLFPSIDTKDYYEIGKMVMLDEMPRNSESTMLSDIIKWIKHNLSIIFLYTWSDGIVGKPGYVYQASNFYYGGYIWTDVYISADGEKIHPRSAKSLLKENSDFSKTGKLFWLTPDFCKHKGITRYRGKQFRYIYPLNKMATNLLSVSPYKWERNNYPKDKDLIWKIQTGKGQYIETTERPVFSKLSININRNNFIENFKETKIELD